MLKKVVGLFAGVGGYFFTGNARNVLGTPKFGGDTTFYVRPARRDGLLITGGIELVSASDHWQPFSGGNQFSLTGGSFRVTTSERVGHPSPFFTAGLFEAHIHSVSERFTDDTLAASAGAGVKYRVTRDITLTAQYRVTTHVHGVNTDGFILSFSLF